MLLEDCRVLDLTNEQGLLCGQLLADLGATVTHVEPRIGSSARSDDVLWRVRTRNQHSMALDLDTESDRRRFLRSVAQCDIVVESGEPPLVPLGLGFDQLVAANPSLVLVSITPFGTFGPKAGYAATDIVVQAASGTMAMTGFSDRAPLRHAGVTAWDHAGAAAAGGALLAWRLARRDGVATHVDVSAQEAESLAAAFTLLNAAIGNRAPLRLVPDGGGLANGIFPCADGFVANTIGAIGALRHFVIREVDWLLAEAAIEPRIAAAVRDGAITPEVMVEVDAAVRAHFATRTKAELLDAALAHGFVLAPVNTALEALRSEQFAARGAWWNDGTISIPGPFARFQPDALTLRNPAPNLDDHPAELDDRAADDHAADDHAADTKSAPPVTQATARAALPLEGVRVLDFGWVMAGPYATRIMADYGATVIKVESATRLDLVRVLPPFYRYGALPENSAAFAAIAAGKSSLALDLGHPDARRVLLDLVRWADVVCEAFAPGAMARLGLDYESLKAIKPDIVMVSSSLFGQTGPYASMPGYGTQGSAVAGITLATGYPDRAPVGPYGPFTDFLAPRYQLLAVLAALHQRDRTGNGQYIDVSQAETGLQAMGPAVARASIDGSTLDREANSDRAMRPHGVYPAAGDDSWVAIAVRDGRDWRSLCNLLGRSDLAGAPPPADVDEIVAAWTCQRDAQDAERDLQAAGIPAHHVLTTDTAQTDPHVHARAMFMKTTFGGRDALIASSGYHLSSSPAVVGTAPSIGEHNIEALRVQLGYTDADIDALVAAGALNIPPASPTT